MSFMVDPVHDSYMSKQIKSQHRPPRPNISILIVHHSLQKSISHEAEVNDKFDVPHPSSENRSSEPPKYLGEKPSANAVATSR